MTSVPSLELYIFVIIVTSFIQMIPMLVMAWTVIIAFFGLIKKKEAPAENLDDFKNGFSIVICAHNEENSIRSLLDSLRDLDYPREKFHIYVTCDHCTDRTAQIAATYENTTIYKKTDGDTRGKGDVLSWVIPKILEDSEKTGYEALVFFDADNVVKSDFLIHINRMLNMGEDVIQGNRLGGKPYITYITKWYTVYWACFSTYFSFAREKLGISCFLTGTGWAVKKELLADSGWNTRSITEDVEYSIQNCIEGRRVAFCYDAVCYDEQPSDFGVMMNQLSRWTTGAYQILGEYHRMIAESPKERFVQKLDNIMLLLMGPCSWIAAILSIVNNIIMIWDYMFRDMPLYFFFPAALFASVSLIFTYIGAYAAVKFNRIPFSKIGLNLLTFPFFVFFYMLCSVKTCFFPATEWIKVEHRSLDADQT